VVLGKVVCQIEFSGCPEKIELALVDSVFHPPVSHVERFGELLTHFGIEDSVGGAIVGFDGRSCVGLWVSELFEHGQDGAGMSAALVHSSCFSF
jgi:hypothetical protein